MAVNQFFMNEVLGFSYAWYFDLLLSLRLNVVIGQSLADNDFMFQKRAKLNIETPSIPMDVRAEKALEAIYVCCFGRNPIEKEDEELLCLMLSAVFPSVEQPEIQRIVKDKAKKVAEGTDEVKVPEPKNLPKEAVKLQMKDLQFLKQNTET